MGFIGLGAMGWHMARHLQSRFPTSVWNRTRTKAEDHGAQFGTGVVKDIADFKAPVIFCCVPTSEEVREVARSGRIA